MATTSGLRAGTRGLPLLLRLLALRTLATLETLEVLEAGDSEVIPAGRGLLGVVGVEQVGGAGKGMQRPGSSYRLRHPAHAWALAVRA